MFWLNGGSKEDTMQGSRKRTVGFWTLCNLILKQLLWTLWRSYPSIDIQNFHSKRLWNALKCAGVKLCNVFAFIQLRKAIFHLHKRHTLPLIVFSAKRKGSIGQFFIIPHQKFNLGMTPWFYKMSCDFSDPHMRDFCLLTHPLIWNLRVDSSGYNQLVFINLI